MILIEQTDRPERESATTDRERVTTSSGAFTATEANDNVHSQTFKREKQ